MELIADYRIQQLIGEGSDGRLYVAEPPERLERQGSVVALKVLVRYGDDGAYDRVVETLTRFVSSGAPNLLDIYDVGRQEGAIFYAMELVPNGSLARSARQLERAEVLRAVAAAARAAHGLHEVGLAHQGVKPSNILLAGTGPVLAEPNLASIVAPGQTVTGLDLGAVEYLDPRVLAGEPPGRASDIWAFGVTLHRALSGDSIHDGSQSDDVMALLRSVMADEPRLSPDLDSGDSELVSWCLGVDGRRRPATAAELADAIEARMRDADTAGASP